MSIAQRFQAFLTSLELTDAERDKVSAQQEAVRDRLRAQLGGVWSSALVGSYRRRTAIRPLNDVDVFLVLDPAAHRRGSPLQLLQRIDDALRRAYPTHQPRVQGRSVNIEFTGTGVGYDIVPAFVPPHEANHDEPSYYEIPDRHQSTWIKTKPSVHRETLVRANGVAGGMLNPLIKAAKHWNCIGEKALLRSFHLEVMSYSAFTAPPASLPAGALHLFTHLASRLALRCPDPAGLGPDLDDDLTPAKRGHAQDRLAHAAESARRAIEADRRGDEAAAVAQWRDLFGPAFR